MPQVIEPAIETFAKIKVVGVGGAGGAAINRMVEAGIDGVEYISINTDAQALHNSKADVKLHIGKETTKGLGAGADPVIGEQAAEESLEDIRKEMTNADMAFITLGAGGGTGSGAGYIVAQAARDQGALVVGFATKPFAFEGEKRRRNAEVAIDKLRRSVDTLIVIPNDRLLQTIDRQTPLLEAFKVADDVLRQGVQGISDLITVHGLINLDFADVKTVMSNAGSALMGIGRASGENRAVVAAQQAIESPLLEISIDGARGILFNVIGGNDLTMHEINAAAETITNAADPDANIIFGATINPELEGEVIVTVVATGFEASYFTNRQSVAQSRQGVEEIEEPEPVTSVTDESTTGISRDEETEISNLDMSLEEKNKTTSSGFNLEDEHEPMANIWTTDKDEPDNEDNQAVTSNDVGDEAPEEPSFLRRLRHYKTKKAKKDNSKEEK